MPKILKFLKFLINKILRRVDENFARIIRDIYDSFYQELENYRIVFYAHNNSKAQA